MKVLMLFDLSIPLTPEQMADYFRTEDWESEADIARTLKRLGHEVRAHGLHRDVRPLLAELEEFRPDIVFNLCEAFRGDRALEPHIPALLELMGVRYTGAGVSALRLCKDKALTKKILNYHRIAAPQFKISHRARPLRSLRGFPLPAFVKPLRLEASEGIAQLSFAETEADALERVRYINDRLGADAIVEEFVEGRELYVGVLGNGGRERLRVFPPRELFFRNLPKDEPRFATFKAKWDDAYRKKWGISTGPAGPMDPELTLRVLDTCRKIYRIFQLRGYARLDLRVTPAGRVCFIEANPNPSIARDDDFAQAADRAGLSYPKLVQKILDLGSRS